MIECLNPVPAEVDGQIAHGTIIVEIAGQIKRQVTPAGIVPQGVIVVQPVGYIEDGIRMWIILQHGVIVEGTDAHSVADSADSLDVNLVCGRVPKFHVARQVEAASSCAQNSHIGDFAAIECQLPAAAQIQGSAVEVYLAVFQVEVGEQSHRAKIGGLGNIGRLEIAGSIDRLVSGA